MLDSIIRYLANCLYESLSRLASLGQCTQTPDSGMAQKPAQRIPAAGGWRPGEGWRVRAADSPQAARQPAYRERAPQGSDRCRLDSRQADQAMDLLQAR